MARRAITRLGMAERIVRECCGSESDINALRYMKKADLQDAVRLLELQREFIAVLLHGEEETA